VLTRDRVVLAQHHAIRIIAPVFLRHICVSGPGRGPQLDDRQNPPATNDPPGPTPGTSVLRTPTAGSPCSVSPLSGPTTRNARFVVLVMTDNPRELSAT
jgi:hypothetical protein